MCERSRIPGLGIWTLSLQEGLKSVQPDERSISSVKLKMDKKSKRGDKTSWSLRYKMGFFVIKWRKKKDLRLGDAGYVHAEQSGS